jgi:hypothetical protein
MTAIALPAAARARTLLAELLDRQRLLALYGLAALVLAIPLLALQAFDPRTLHGVSVWVKPAKFLVSVGIFSLTAAWFWGYVAPDRRGTRAMRATAAVLVGTASFELLYIIAQAGRGLDSHFNLTAPFYIAMYALMGVAAVLLVGTTLPLAWQIVRHPARGLSGDFAAALAAGLVLTFLLGGGLGFYMSQQAGHAVGTQGGQVPLFGWNRSGGDLRVAHFLGIHAEQAIPLLALLVAGRRERLRRAALALGVLAYVGLTVAVFAQAVAGRPLLPL